MYMCDRYLYTSTRPIVLRRYVALMQFKYNQGMKQLIVDSNMTLTAALKNSKAPRDIQADLEIVTVRYLGFDDNVHQGQLVVHRDLQDEIADIFEQLLLYRFPVFKVVPIAAYDWDDHASIRDNNTSAFNYRSIFGTKTLSNHSYGRAIDINPRTNPYITEKGVVRPSGPPYDPTAKGAIVDGDAVVRIFLEHGWQWQGYRKEQFGEVDYQHFEKVV